MKTITDMEIQGRSVIIFSGSLAEQKTMITYKGSGIGFGRQLVARQFCGKCQRHVLDGLHINIVVKCPYCDTFNEVAGNA